MQGIGTDTHKFAFVEAGNDAAEMGLVHVQTSSEVGGRLFPIICQLVKDACFRQSMVAGEQMFVEQPDFPGKKAIETLKLRNSSTGSMARPNWL